MRLAVAAILISVAAMTGACSEMSYLNSFELRQAVCDLSYPGVDCAQSGSGGIGALAGGTRGSGSAIDLTVSTIETFHLERKTSESFSLAAFLSHFASSVRRDLESSGYDVAESPTESGVSLQYTSAGLDGHLEISARIASESLVIDLNGRESTKR